MKYTTGPWEVRENFSLAVFAKGGYRSICTGGFTDGTEESFKENQENMKLIAIAPEMYELLKEIRKYKTPFLSTTISKTMIDEVLKKYEGE